MKKYLFLIIIIVCSFFQAGNTFAQCTPDTVGCIDTLDPGQICPDTLPNGEVDVQYNQVVTILPPYEGYISGYDVPIPIIKIIVDSIGNLPPGITYESNAAEFYPDTAYCILLSGTPTTPGTYDLSIKVIPYIIFLGYTVEWEPQIDDTSLAITINYPAKINISELKDFYIINKPNPFRYSTKIGYFSIKPENIELKIYDLTGQILYNEKIKTPPGKNFFNFNGEFLKSGMYFYSISGKKRIYSNRLFKVK